MDKPKERSSKYLKDALKVRVQCDKDGKPILVGGRYKRGMLMSRIKGVYRYYFGI